MPRVRAASASACAWLPVIDRLDCQRVVDGSEGKGAKCGGMKREGLQRWCLEGNGGGAPELCVTTPLRTSSSLSRLKAWKAPRILKAPMRW